MVQTRKRKAAAQAPATKKRWSGRMLNSGKKVSAITQANSIQSPLLALPAEIRNRIYTLVLGVKTLHPEAYHTRGPGGRDIVHVPISICTADAHDHDFAVKIRHSTEPIACPTYLKRHQSCLPVSNGIDNVEKYSVALLHACRQVHSEAALIPFETNTFSFSFRYDLHWLMSKLMNIQKRAIQSVVISGSGIFINKRDAAALTGLKHVVIFNHTTSQDPERMMGYWRRTLQLLPSSRLTSATYCMLKSERDHSHPPGDGVGNFMTYPAISTAMCEEFEAKLLGLPRADDGTELSSRVTITDDGNE